jgi:hypothetical protein
LARKAPEVEMRGMLAWKRDPDAAANELIAFLLGLELGWLRDSDLDVLSLWETFCDHFFV